MLITADPSWRSSCCGIRQSPLTSRCRRSSRTPTRRSWTATSSTPSSTWYLPGVDISDHTALPVTIAPANAADFRGLAPAYIGTAEHDPLRDDGAHYAELLNAAGVPAELSNEPTLVHGYRQLRVAHTGRRRGDQPRTRGAESGPAQVSPRPGHGTVGNVNGDSPDYHMPHRRRRVLGHRRRHQARSGRVRRLPDRRGRRRRRRHLALEHLSRYRRGHSVVFLPVLLRAAAGLVADLCAGQRVEGLRRTLRRQVRDPAEDPVQHQGSRRGVRRRAGAVAGAHRSGRRGHRAIPDQRQRCAHRAQAARHRRRRLLRRRRHAHRPLGSQPGSDRQAGRRDRHRRLGRAADPRDRADCQRAQGISAHTDLVLPEVRRAAAQTGALGDAPARHRGQFSG